MKRRNGTTRLFSRGPITVLAGIALTIGVSSIALAASGGGNPARNVPAGKMAAELHADPGLNHAATAVSTPHARKHFSRYLDKIPAKVLPAGTPIPVAPSLIQVTNAWLVSNGSTLVAVYAGSSGTNPADGRFVIIRQNGKTGVQTEMTVDVPGAGAVRLEKTPSGASVETSAQTGDLSFTDATGATGTLNLANNKANVG